MLGALVCLSLCTVIKCDTETLLAEDCYAARVSCAAVLVADSFLMLPDLALATHFLPSSIQCYYSDDYDVKAAC